MKHRNDAGKSDGLGATVLAPFQVLIHSRSHPRRQLAVRMRR
jgi:hypothetical protein